MKDIILRLNNVEKVVQSEVKAKELEALGYVRDGVAAKKENPEETEKLKEKFGIMEEKLKDAEGRLEKAEKRAEGLELELAGTKEQLEAALKASKKK